MAKKTTTPAALSPEEIEYNALIARRDAIQAQEIELNKQLRALETERRGLSDPIQAAYKRMIDIRAERIDAYSTQAQLVLWYLTHGGDLVADRNWRRGTEYTTLGGLNIDDQLIELRELGAGEWAKNANSGMREFVLTERGQRIAAQVKRPDPKCEQWVASKIMDLYGGPEPKRFHSFDFGTADWKNGIHASHFKRLEFAGMFDCPNKDNYFRLNDRGATFFLKIEGTIKDE